jgi:predicted dehydrogenase
MRGPVKVVVVGAGGRGTGYAEYAAAHPKLAKVVGVAEPRDHYRDWLVKRHGIPCANAFRDWRDMARVPRFADAVVIGTPDALHTGPAIAFARRGYHMLLEKPMAPTAGECRTIVREVKKARVILAVGHVMRYTAYTRALKRVVESGRIGEVVSVEHLEPVGYWHMAHSFVRGNWRNQRESSFMLLAKSCHDLDWLRHVVGLKCRAVSSFGSLYEFRRSRKPRAAGKAKRCLDCRFERRCPFSAVKLYVGMARKGHYWWPLDVITTEHSIEGVRKALREGPYGRCVYECDNDVVDHQVVNMSFAGGVTASFTMCGLTEMTDRKTRIFGTRGQVTGDGRNLVIYDFLTEKRETIDTHASAGTVTGGHGGGDTGLMGSFVSAVATGRRNLILSGPDETLESHLMVFAAEKSRVTGRVVGL